MAAASAVAAGDGAVAGSRARPAHCEGLSDGEFARRRRARTCWTLPRLTASSMFDQDGGERSELCSEARVPYRRLRRARRTRPCVARDRWLRADFGIASERA
jgi:hypothetical protein